MLAVVVDKELNRIQVYEIHLYSLDSLCKAKNDPNIAPQYVLSLDEEYNSPVEISQIRFLQNSNRSKLSFISTAGLENNWFLDRWEYELRSKELKRVKELKSLKDKVFILKLIPQESGKEEKLIFCWTEGIPEILNISDGEEDIFRDFSSCVVSLCISENRTDVAVMNESKEIRILNTYSRDLKTKILPFKDFSPEIIRFSSGRLLTIGSVQSEDKYDEKCNNILRILDFTSAPPEYFDLSFDKNCQINVIEMIEREHNVPIIFFGTQDGQIFYWDVNKDEVPCLLFTPENKNLVVALIPNIYELVCGVHCCFKNGRLMKFKNINDKSIVPEELLSDQESELTCGAHSKNYTHLITGSSDHCVRIIELDTLKEKIFTGHSSPIRAVGFFFETFYAISASEDCNLKVFEVESGREIYSFTDVHQINSICVSLNSDTIILGTTCGIRIIERVINTREKLLRFLKINKNIRNLVLNTHEFNEDDLALTPFPFNFSLLSIATIFSNQELIEDLRSFSSLLISSSPKQRLNINRSLFIKDRFFNLSPWDWITLIMQMKDYLDPQIQSIIINILFTSHKITSKSLELISKKNLLLNSCAQINPDNLSMLLNSFWMELGEQYLEIFDFKVSTNFVKRLIFNIKRMIPVINLQTKEFPLYILSKTHSNNIRQLYNKTMKSDCLQEPNGKFIKCKVYVSLITLDEILDTSKSQDSSVLSLTENFDPNHSVFSSQLLQAIVESLWRLESFNSFKFYVNIIIFIAFILLICLNTLVFIPEREKKQRLNSDEFKLLQTFSLVTDILLLLVIIYIVFRQVKRKRISGKVGISNISNWGIVTALIGLIGVFTCSLDIVVSQSENSTMGHWASVAKCSWALFFALSWLKLLKFSKGIRSTSVLIRTFKIVTLDMIPFFTIILFLLVGTSISTYILQSSYADHSPWEFFKLNYFVLLGDYDDFKNIESALNKEVFFIILFSITVVVVIFLLNLLIAIISDSNAKVRSKEHENEIYNKITIINKRLKEMTENEKEAVLKVIHGKFCYKIEKVIDEENNETNEDKNRRKLESIEEKIDFLLNSEEEKKLYSNLLEIIRNMENKLQDNFGKQLEYNQSMEQKINQLISLNKK